MTTFLLAIFGLCGSRYLIKYLLGFNKVDSTSHTATQKISGNISQGNSNTSYSVGKAVPFVLKQNNKTHSITTTDKTKSDIKKGSVKSGVEVSQSSNDFGDSVDHVYVSEFSKLKLYPEQIKIQSGEKIQFKLAGLDRFDNHIEISDRISWSATAGEIDSTGLFSFDSIDDVLVTVTAKVREIEATAKVNIENVYELLAPPKLKSLKVIPDCIYLKPDEEKVFLALGFDRHDNPIDCGELIWSATGGMIDRDGKLIVSNNAKGIYQVTATSKNTAKHGAVVKTTLLTLGVSTRILSWAISNEEFFYDILAPLLNLTNDDDSLSETDAIVQGWILEIGRRRVAELLKKASNLSFKEAFSNLSDSIDYIVLPELRKIEFVNPPSKVQQGDRVQLKVIGLDQARDRINVDNQIIWTATSGLIDSQGIFVANGDTDSVEITVKAKGTNITTKIKIKIEVCFEEHYIDSAKIETSNNSSNSIKAIVSKTKEIVSNTNFRRGEKTSENAANSEKPEKTSFHTDNIKQNADSSTNEQKKEIKTTSKSLSFESQSDSPNGSSSNTDSSNSNCNSSSSISSSANEQEKETKTTSKSLSFESQSDSPNGSSSNTDSSNSNCNSSSSISPIGICDLKPIKHYKNIAALERLKATRVCDTDRKLLSYLNLTEEQEFKIGKASHNKSSSNNFSNDKH